MSTSEKGLGFALAVTLVSVPMILLEGYTFKCLWDWFVGPLFMMPAIKFWNALGLYLLLSFTTYSYKKKEPLNIETVSEMISDKLLVCTISIAFGLIISLFIKQIVQ